MARTVLARFALVPVLVFPASAGVWIVDASLPTGFVEIQSAVDAASDGDTLLVKTGSYSGFVLVDKDLTVVADELNDVQIHGTIAVEKLGAEKTVLFAGLNVVGETDGVRLQGNAGIVWIEGCVFSGAPSQACQTPAVAAHVQNCDRVVIVRSDFHGSSAEPGQGAGGDALRVIDSSVVTHNSGFIGGAASWQNCGGGPYDGANGGSGAHVSGSSFLFASADRYMGAAGGDGSHIAAGGNGGNGLVVVAPAQLEMLSSDFLAGAAGAGGGCGLPECEDGEPGAPSIGDVHVLPGETTTATNGPPVREGMPCMTILYGYPGQRYAFDIAPHADFRWSLAQRGVALTKDGRRLPFGVIPPSGVIGVLLTAPTLGAGEQARRIFLQTIYWGPYGPLTLGSPRAIVVLDSAF
jgi:hypothetical protein